MAALLPGQLLARAQQLPQFLDLLLRNKTATDQAVGQQIGDPGRVADIGLTTRNILAFAETSSKSPSLRMFQTGFQ
jgi:hypothetical protein